MFTKFGVDSSNRFSFTAQTLTQTHKFTDATGRITHVSATAGVGNDDRRHHSFSFFAPNVTKQHCENDNNYNYHNY